MREETDIMWNVPSKRKTKLKNIVVIFKSCLIMVHIGEKLD